ncbi:MAG: hypothetical protein M0036_08355 [Desulfobacteraceae bacterium]|nr:hypothetical protein [Desulfobacteraceae bacterium]
MKRLIWLFILTISSALIACGGGSSSSPSSLGSAGGGNTQLLEAFVAPTDTDPAISIDTGDHYISINPDVSAKGKLFLFFPGTSAQPKGYTFIVQAAANNGYHAVGLAYVNDNTAYSLCNKTNDTLCPGNLHEEVLTGQDVSSVITVPVADSIENRLTKLLIYLNQQRPNDGWDQFLDSADNILWNRIRVAGHSQGGSTAGYIATRFTVDRAIFFSSPYDQVNNQMAAWIAAGNGASDPSRYYGFSHMNDQTVPWMIALANWTALNMNQFGDYLNVDSSSPPYNGSHMLSTNLPPVIQLLGYHNITVVDSYTPLDATGQPVYLPVWQYLCFQ